MDSMQIYNEWLKNDYIDLETKEELKKIENNSKEIEERFYRDLEFGTGGLRGIIGAGTNRMNIYTVRKASQGLANYIIKSGLASQGIAVSYDSRHKSPVFAMEASRVFAANGIKAYLVDELRPVPVLSFAVRHLKAAAGIMITASHNPKEYNGYKVYGNDGGQASLEASNAVLEEIGQINDFSKIKLIDQNKAIEEGLIQIIGKEVDDEYIKCLKTLSINPEIIPETSKNFKIIYTPIHGTGNKPVRRILDELGFANVLIVKEQELPDPNFTTVRSPNPEEKDAFEIAIELAKKENVDLIIGTDPDCDRVGIVVRNNKGEYITFTGNQTGCLLLDYILSQKKEKNSLDTNGFVCKTIVTTELTREIANYFNIDMIEVLTGFKFIGEQIRLLDECGSKKYLFGFEESYGYLAGTFARDKDAVVASMLIAEMAAFYKTKNMTLYDALSELYKKYGYAKETLTSYTLKGKDGLEKISSTMEHLRNNVTSSFGKIKLSAFRDYKKGFRLTFDNSIKEILTLPESDVLYYETQDKSWFCVRPSGTEPKIKVYYGVIGNTEEESDLKLDNLKNNALEVIVPLLGI